MNFPPEPSPLTGSLSSLISLTSFQGTDTQEKRIPGAYSTGCGPEREAFPVGAKRDPVANDQDRERRADENAKRDEGNLPSDPRHKDPAGDQ